MHKNIVLIFITSLLFLTNCNQSSTVVVSSLNNSDSSYYEFNKENDNVSFYDDEIIEMLDYQLQMLSTYRYLIYPHLDQYSNLEPYFYGFKTTKEYKIDNYYVTYSFAQPDHILRGSARYYVFITPDGGDTSIYVFYYKIPCNYHCSLSDMKEPWNNKGNYVERIRKYKDEITVEELIYDERYEEYNTIKLPVLAKTVELFNKDIIEYLNIFFDAYESLLASNIEIEPYQTTNYLRLYKNAPSKEIAWIYDMEKYVRAGTGKYYTEDFYNTVDEYFVNHTYEDFYNRYTLNSF